MKLYAVTLSHSAGLFTVTTTGEDHTEAIAKVCEWERAPESAVTMWREATPEESRKWAKILGV